MMCCEPISNSKLLIGLEEYVRLWNYRVKASMRICFLNNRSGKRYKAECRPNADEAELKSNI